MKRQVELASSARPSTRLRAKVHGYNAVVDPDWLLERFEKDKRTRDPSIQSWYAAEALMLSMALSEVRAQLEEAERLLADLGQARVELIPEASVPEGLR